MRNANCHDVALLGVKVVYMKCMNNMQIITLEENRKQLVKANDVFDCRCTRQEIGVDLYNEYSFIMRFLHLHCWR